MKPEYPFETQIFDVLGWFGHIQVVNTTPGSNLKFLKFDSIGRSRFLLVLSFYGLFYVHNINIVKYRPDMQKSENKKLDIVNLSFEVIFSNI